MSVFWSLFFVLTLVVVYFAFVRQEIEKFKLVSGVYATIDGYEASLKQRLQAAFAGAKTAVLGAIGVVTSALSFLPPDTLPGLHDVSWSAFVSEGTALKISSFLMIAMIVTHAVGLRRAAEVEPKKDK